MRHWYLVQRVLSKSELATFDGSNGGPIYLAVLGQVFDVTHGKKYYGKRTEASPKPARDFIKLMDLECVCDTVD